MLEVLLKTWKKTTSKKFFNIIGGTSFGSYLSLFLMPKNYTIVKPDDPIYRPILVTCGIIVGLYLLRFIWFLLVYTVQHLYIVYKERQYGNIMIMLHEVYAIVNNLNRKDDISDEDFLTVMFFACQQLKKIYTQKTKKMCSVSIKLVVDNTNIDANKPVKNLCRDTQNSERDTKQYDGIVHHIFSNSCYNSILTRLLGNKKDIFYVNNNISEDKNYENTSRPCYKEGKLPYESELVVPIIPKLRDDNPNLMGFLCIDCKEKNAFTDKYNIAIAEGIAESIYDLIKRHKSQTIEAQILINEVIKTNQDGSRKTTI
jgi:hypothetical protein